MRKCLLFNPPSALHVYNESKVRVAIPKLANLSLAMIAGSLIEEGFDVKVIDLMLIDIRKANDAANEEIIRFKPDIIGVTATTPLFYEAAQISNIAKSISPDILTVLGGPHASSLPFDSLKESSFDCVVVGEGEMAIKEIVKSNSLEGIRGVYCRKNIDGDISSEEAQKTLDVPIEDLPFPALNLFEAKNYICPKVIARNNPVGPIEMSRGCIFNCSFCNKKVFGRKFRIKTPKRVIEELLVLKKIGYREFHVLDDQFTTEIDKAKEICEEIIMAGIHMSWNLRTGIRVDKIDKEFLELARRAGCYQVGIGFESGNQMCLDKIGKDIKIEQGIKASELIRKAGIESVGFFMLGFLSETEETMNDTIRFAIKLNPDYAKATILVPFPGTNIYNEFKNKGFIKTYDWSKYNFHNVYEIYQHPTLSWDVLNYYYDLFYRRFYFRPSYLVKRCWKSIMHGTLLNDLFSGYEAFLKKNRKEKGNVNTYQRAN